MKLLCTAADDYRLDLCGQPAEILILTEKGEVFRDYSVNAYCAEHGLVEAHEAASSMTSDEFRVINLGTACVGGAL